MPYVMAKIVTIGGGTGQPELLRFLASSSHDITAVVSVMDNGGSSGVLREAYHVLPPGDLRRCILALSSSDDARDRLWNYRFTDGPLAPHPVGNIVLAALMRELNNPQEAIDSLMRSCGARGRVLPVTDALAQLCARLSDGTVVNGETNIDVPTHDPALRIEQLWLEPSVSATPAVRIALRDADLVVLSMGDLYTSIVPNLLVDGVGQSIAEGSARVVAVCNGSTKAGETNGFTTDDFARVFQRYLAPAQLHTLLVDSGTRELSDDAEPCVPLQPLSDARVELRCADIADEHQPTRISGEKVAAVINTLCNS